MINGDPTFLLVHGSWHLGDCWSAVAAHLRGAGFSVATPTLAGHGRDCDRDVTHDDYVHSVVTALDRLPGEIVLVGHSFGGSVISRVAELRPDRCRLLVYYTAFVPFLEEGASDRLDRSVTLPLDLFTAAFANSTDRDTAANLHARLVPEPAAPIFEPLSLPRFHELGIPSAYISCAHDLALPPGRFHPGQSSRLDAPQLIEIDADHEALLTAPRRLAWALLEAVRPDTRRQSVAA